VALGRDEQYSGATTVAFFGSVSARQGSRSCFEMFERRILRHSSLQSSGGQIIDATFVPVPSNAIPAKRTEIKCWEAAGKAG